MESEDPLEPVADSQQIYPSFASVPFPPLRPQQRQAPVEQVPELTPDSQHYFPSFSSIFSNHPLGHSRPPVYDDPPSSHRARHIPYALQQANSFDAFATNNGGSGKDKNSFTSSPSTTSKEQSGGGAGVGASSNQAVLGSGNFGVIRGGTFYEDDYDQGSTNDDFFYYGGGRPSYSYNYRPTQSATTNGDDFFANFRDFADITAPKQPQQGAYSELHVVYANKNGTLRDAPPAVGGPPRNIFEQLEQLEQQQPKPKPKKVSKIKAKLAKHQQKEASKLEWKKMSFQQSPKDLYQEPLLALS